MGLSFPGTGMQVDKLWEHPNSGESFHAQRVSVDLSGYDAVFVTFRNVAGIDQIAPVVMAPLHQTAALNGYYNESNTNIVGFTTRSFTAQESYVEFTGGAIYIALQSAPHADDNVSIPAAIYGVKF